MQKIPVIIVVLNPININNALNTLNFNNASLLGMISETNQPKTVALNYKNMRIPLMSFSAIGQLLNQAKNAYWLICGFSRDAGEIYKTKKFLLSNGVSDDHVVNFEIIPNMNTAWIANVRYIEKNPVDYFATGISYMEQGLNFQAMSKGGVLV